jgi:flagella basal body P-ring formation protein FlgA
VKISTEGMALSNGQLGEIILVSNVDTGVKLKAKIKNSHQAEIITKQFK